MELPWNEKKERQKLPPIEVAKIVRERALDACVYGVLGSDKDIPES